jgi:membrane protein DedA with SNARE-associated domain
MEFFLAIFFGTYVLEDLALVSALALVQEEKITAVSAFWACFFGIATGDLIVYGIGYMARSTHWRRWQKWQERFSAWLRQFKHEGTLTYMIFISRAVPGTRLPTYLLAGYTGYPFFKFILFTLISVFGWVLLTFMFGQAIQHRITDHWFITAVCMFGSLIILKKAFKVFTDKWSRQTWKWSLLKWRYFEFWPAWLFYIPIIPRYIFLSMKYRSFYLPFYANPQIEHAGFIGESKWDFYEPLVKSRFSLKTQLIRKGPEQLTRVINLISENVFFYPFILKPDRGQRGFGVRVIRNEPDLRDYLAEADFDLLIQEFCEFPNEAGVFYFRYPGESVGKIFSITDKIFPSVTGDGTTSLGQLILQDKRARLIAPTYFARLRGRLDTVPSKGESVLLAHCGNHCQGTIFLNGEFLYTTKLQAAIESIAQLYPHFYFGRFDVRYSSTEALKQGREFRVIELNGAGSEATHIWDSTTTLTQAYAILFRQWEILFTIGYRVNKTE